MPELAHLALSGSERLILVAILAGLMLFVVFFELRIMRGKSREVKRASLKKDEAFNAVLTTRSVMNAIKNQGGDTGACQELLTRAKDAMNRGNYDACIDLCDKAKSELTMPTPREVSAAKPGDVEEKDRLERVARSILSSSSVAETDSYKGTKLMSAKEGNYLGAKFEISAAKADIGRAARDGLDTSVAESLMVEADAAYTGGNYNKALSLAVRARKAISAEAAEEAIPLRAEETKPAPPGEVFDVEEEEARAPDVRPCSHCGAIIERDDMFCPKCGARVPKERVCPTCGSKPKASDVFCRKCGSKVDLA